MRIIPSRFFILVVLLAPVFAPSTACAKKPQAVFERMRHLRIAGPREWSDFPQTAEEEIGEFFFGAQKNETPFTLQLRQQDVKQTWAVQLNGHALGKLSNDGADRVLYFTVPPNTLRDGRNQLRIEHNQRRKTSPDDIRVGEIVLHARERREVLSAARVAIQVFDADAKKLTPCRLTIVRADGALQTVAAESNDHLAVRPGVVYTSTGRAEFGLPAGKYTIYAGRGFEYSLAQWSVDLATGAVEEQKLSIRRETPTEGYVACDTHIHTREVSGHGDATLAERMITLAGEGIELPIATEHNINFDYAAKARALHARQYFTPVIGNEVTTKLGHFNVFPVVAGSPIPNFKRDNWRSIFTEIYQTPGVRVVILNHARDIHSGTRPFGPSLQNEAVGENLAGWNLRANAMEVINSGATQTDALQLFRDWLTQLNRGRILTPVGCSDSHDVSRYIVGQGRTYIRCNDADPANIDVQQAVNNFLAGRVSVSFGLLTELTVEGKFQPGDIAPVFGDSIRLNIRVLGPHWTRATRVRLYANGQLLREEEIDAKPSAAFGEGVKWEADWTIPAPKHDVHLVALASGPGIDGLYWNTAKPYQPTSPVWKSRSLGFSGAVWLDIDGDGRRTSARQYAERLFAQSCGDLPQLLQSLAPYDAAVAAQAAHLVQESNRPIISNDVQSALRNASSQTQAGFHSYLEAWRKNQLAQSR